MDKHTGLFNNRGSYVYSVRHNGKEKCFKSRGKLFHNHLDEILHNLSSTECVVITQEIVSPEFYGTCEF